MIRPQMFSRRIEPIGQQEWWLSQTLTSSFSFVVPQGVTKISAVIVGNSYTQIARGAAVLLSGATSLGGGVGGGNGGASGNGDGRPGGGGAGGYTGNGGRGGDSTQVPAPTVYSGTAGSPGSGGGGGGGGGRSGNSGSAGAGGGVGLKGQGNNGAGGAVNADGGYGSVNGSLYGGGSRESSGANLRWLNDIPVTPGETLTVKHTADVGSYTKAARIIWGGGRSFPNNALDM